MIAPLAMKLREQGVKVKIAYLGHRDGSTVMVRSDLTQVKSLKDLKGMTFAIPSKYSNQNLVIRKLMKDEGVEPGRHPLRRDCRRPTCRARWPRKAIDAYFIGEPHAARAELDGTGRVLYHAKDIWPHFISCVLVVTEKLIDERPGVVQRPGARHRRKRRVGRDATGSRRPSWCRPYFRQDEKLLRYVLTQPPDRVSYRMLTPADDEMQRIADMALEAGILERRLDVQRPGGPPVHPGRHQGRRDHRAIGARPVKSVNVLTGPGTSCSNSCNSASSPPASTWRCSSFACGSRCRC